MPTIASMLHLIGTLVPVLVYGVLCAALGIVVETVTRPYRKRRR